MKGKTEVRMTLRLTMREVRDLEFLKSCISFTEYDGERIPSGAEVIRMAVRSHAEAYRKAMAKTKPVPTAHVEAKSKANV